MIPPPTPVPSVTMMTSLLPFSTALPHFAKTCNVRIISDFYFQTCLCTEFLRNIDHSPAEIDTPVNNAITPHRTRNTDSHALYITLTDAFLRQLIINRLCNIRQYCLSVIAGIGLDFPFVKKPSACLKNPILRWFLPRLRQIHISSIPDSSLIYVICIFFYPMYLYSTIFRNFCLVSIKKIQPMYP